MVQKLNLFQLIIQITIPPEFFESQHKKISAIMPYTI